MRALRGRPALAGGSGGESRPRVALVVHEIQGQGGMDTALAELIRRGHHRVDFVVVSSTLDEALRPMVAEWRRVRAPRRPFPLRYFWFWWAGGMELRKVRADLVQATGAIVPNKVDVIGVHFCHAGYVRANGNLSDPDAPLLRRANTGLTRVLSIAAERWCFRQSRARVLVAVSRGLEGELEQHFPGVPHVTVDNGVDTERFQPRSTRAAVREVGRAPMVAVFVGGDWQRKGLAVALSAVDLARRRGADVELEVAGKHDAEPFVRLAEDLGLTGKVRFLGPRSDVQRVYQEADVFVLPSAYETFSLAAHEAAASGLPVVATAVHGVPEVVGADEAGFVVSRDAESVATALVKLWDDPELRASMGRRARERVKQFTWERNVQATLALYEELLETTGA